MNQWQTYRTFFFSALFLHGLVAVLLLWDNSNNDRPAMTVEARNTSAPPSPQKSMQETPQAIQAVSVDASEVAAAVNELKAERARTALAEKNKQQALAAQAEAARRSRVAEQQQLARLKAEAAKMAEAQKKQLADEQLHLKQLAQQREIEKKQLEALQNQQRDLQKQKQAEEKNLADLRAKQSQEQARVKEASAAQAAQMAAKQQELIKQAALAKQEQIKQQQAAAMQQASREAADKTRIAGVVDKYKALIIHAISQQWILPDHVDSRLSSQFRIRLAPNGAVLEVSLMRSSGDPILDRSAQSAIYKASPLPVPSEADMFNLFRDISLTVRPENAQG